MWMSLRYDWIGFLNYAAAHFPAFEPESAPDHAEGRAAFERYLGRVSELTQTEASEIVETMLLPAWIDRRYATAAE